MNDKLNAAELLVNHEATITEVNREIVPHSRPLKGGPQRQRITYELCAQDTFDLEKYTSIIRDIQAGMSPSASARDHGIHPATLYLWKNRDETSLRMWKLAHDAMADSLIHRAADMSSTLSDPWSNVLQLDDPRLANAFVNSAAQGARTAIEVAKRVAPHLYADRVDHTTQHQVAFVVSLAPPVGATQLAFPSSSGGQGEVIDTVIVSGSVARKAPKRAGRQGKQIERQPTPPAKQRKQRKDVKS